MQITLESTFYLWSVLIIFPLWLFIFMKKPRSRKEMLIVGIVFGIAGILIGKFYALQDYWHPSYILSQKLNIEDFFYGFLFGGIASEIYEFLFKYEDSDRRLHKKTGLIITFTLVTAVTFLLLVDKLNINSIWAHIIPPFIVGMWVVLVRRDLAKPAFINGLLVLLLVIGWFNVIKIILPNSFDMFWNSDVLLGIYLLGIPVEELLFAFSLGFGASFFYETIMGRTMRKSHSDS